MMCNPNLLVHANRATNSKADVRYEGDFIVPPTNTNDHLTHPRDANKTTTLPEPYDSSSPAQVFCEHFAWLLDFGVIAKDWLQPAPVGNDDIETRD